MAELFEALRDDFVRITDDVIWCSVTTVDDAGRPRSRILHPLWEIVDGRPVGWVVTGRTPVKARHLAANPNVAVSYWSPDQRVVLAECVASWVQDVETKSRVWDLFMTTPPPRGYDLSGFIPDGAADAAFTPLRLDPRSVHVYDGTGFPIHFTPRTAHF
ncbi:pyridoxamine 5'-phosphate oxidase family protein [Actinocrispum wychmicini]|uniref:General stress protein 26 n=1 Tax=Actinocrispum wychmicini TaxID=1213861 RepID=A0A4R2IK81_9PSEU|nr:pyridoxamine 5'-phosphate oxidase family protein [Actinocrispum wychmicini]TCO44248.1 general stress protein 26 [Actinocrispum wychmicini]